MNYYRLNTFIQDLIKTIDGALCPHHIFVYFNFISIYVDKFRKLFFKIQNHK